ncbi:TPA: SIALI-17 repeat-containing surface protein [Streptococcus pneumoniae]
MSLLKKDKFSIRKIKGIVGSVFLGSLLFAPSVIGASTYHYLDYSSLTQTERDQLKQGRPDESKESYALDYEKDALPNTGSSQSIMTALGLLAIGSLIVIITKDNRNKKIATFLIVGATGLVTLSTASALNLNANIHESGRDGVLQISGYRYVGYLELDDKTVSSVSPASTVSPVEQPKVVTEKGEPEVQPALPEAVVTDKGEPEVQPTLPEAVVTDKGEPEVHEKPDYTQPIGANLVEPEVHEKLAYTEPVGTTGVDENGNLIEPPVNDIPEYTEPISTVSEVASEREELPSLHTDIRTETIPKTTIEESDPSKFIGDDSVKEVGEDGERQIVTSYEELHGKKISEPVETVTILKEMKPKILVKGTKENPKEKTVPVLTLTKVTEDAMNRSANLNYELDNKDNAEISSIIAEIKDGDTVVKKVDLSKEKLTDAVQNLDLFKDYKIATTMIYDRGQGSETSKLDEKTLRLELKKVEIKNISSTNLVKVNDDGTEIPSDFMSEKPSDEDVKKMYLKITSRDNKVTRLAVDKIELVTEKEKELYKITASAQDLIQHVDPSKTRNEYIHYIEKPVPKVNNVYYNFNELVRDMQEHPNDEFKLGADLNATNVSAFGKSYVTKDFKGKLLSDGDNHYTIHNLSRPLFGNVIGGTIKNINLGNVDINMPWANQVAAVANIIKGGTTIENVKVKGNIVGKDWVSGFIDKIDNQGTLRNVAFIGNVTSVGDGGQFLTGIVGENWKGLVERAYVNANLIGKKAKAAGIAYWTQNEGNNNTVRQEGAIKKSIAKGTIQVTEAIESGGVVGSMKHHGSVEDSVSMMKVPNGEIFYGSSDIDYDDGYWTGDNVRRNYVVIGVSDGHSSYQRSKDKNRIRPISEEEAKSKIEATGITADKYEINEPVVNRLNRLTRREDEYKSTQDYKVDRDLAYRNIEKLQPFYNKDMRNYNDALMMLDHLEADAVIPKLHGNISRWFKKMDRQYRKNGELHQFDKVRELTEDEKKKIVINNIDDLVNNNLMTKHGAPSDRTYNPEDFDSAYVNINIMTGIYGGNTSQGAPGAASFKHNTFRMWGYFGYENGFISYASSKYQGEADKTNKKLLGDDFIIKKVSKDKFNNLEEWKKQYFKDVKSKAEKGFTAIEIDGRQITNYAQLKTLFAEAVQKDIDGMSDPKIKDHFKNTVDLKSKVFKALLKNTDGFFNKLFKEDI